MLKHKHLKKTEKKKNIYNFIMNNERDIEEITTFKNKIIKLEELLKQPGFKIKSSLKLFESLQELSLRLATNENLEFVTFLDEKEANIAYDFYRSILIAYDKLFDIIKNNQFDIEIFHILRDYISFFQKISRIPLSSIQLQTSMGTLLDFINVFINELPENEIQALLKMGNDLFQCIEAQLLKEKNQNSSLFDLQTQSQCYSMMLIVYGLIYQKYPHQDKLSQITHHLNKSRKEKIKLDVSAYIKCIEIIAGTQRPDFSIIYFCFSQLDKENKLKFGVISSFQSALNTLHLLFSADVSQDVLNARSLSDLIRMFNYLKEECLIDNYLSMIEIMSLHIVLLTPKQLEMTYAFADIFVHSDKYINMAYSIDRIRSFCHHVFTLANAMSTLDLSKLIPFYHQYLTRFSEESIENTGRQLITILLNKQVYPIEEFFPLLRKVTSKISFTPHEIYRLILNIITLYSQEQTEIFLIELCNQYRAEIRANNSLYTLLITECDQLFLEKLQDHNFLMDEQKKYQELQNLVDKACEEIEKITESQAFNKIKIATTALIQSNEAMQVEDKIIFVKNLAIQYQRLYRIYERANSYEISMNRYLTQFARALKEKEPSMNELTECVSACQQKVNEEIESIQEEKSCHLELKEAQEMLKEGSYESLVKINRWLRHFRPDQDLLTMKIQCLMKLGYYEQALIWLEKAHILFPKNEMQSRLLWAECCLLLGQYQTALETYQDIYNKADKKCKNHHLLMQIAYAHQMLGSSKHYDEAFKIYADLKTRLIETQKKVTDSQYKEKLDQQLKRVIVAEIKCLIFSNQLDEAEESILLLKTHETERWILLAELYQGQCRFKEASANYETLLQQKFQFNWMKALFNCYVLAHDLSEQKMDCFLTLLAQHEQHVPAYFELKVKVLMHRKEYQLALNELHLMVKTWGISQFISMQESICHAKLGDMKKAIAILISFPDYCKNKTVLKQLAMTYGQASMQKEALECFDYLLSEYPTFIPVYAKAISYGILINDKEYVMKYWAQLNSTNDKVTKSNIKLKRKVESYLAATIQDITLEEGRFEEKPLILEELYDDAELEEDFDTKMSFEKSTDVDWAEDFDENGLKALQRVSEISIFQPADASENKKCVTPEFVVCT